jgi:hypothetical protein
LFFNKVIFFCALNTVHKNKTVEDEIVKKFFLALAMSTLLSVPAFAKAASSAPDVSEIEFNWCDVVILVCWWDYGSPP